MATRAQKIRLGLFMMMSVVILIGGAVTLIGINVWNVKSKYFVRYTASISGLDVGSSVKMRGVRVGQVESISVNMDYVQVNFTTMPATKIRSDVTANAVASGITGLKFIELSGGTRGAELIKPNSSKSQVKAGEATSLTGKAADVAEMIQAAVNNINRMIEANRRIAASHRTPVPGGCAARSTPSGPGERSMGSTSCAWSISNAGCVR